MRGSFCLFAAVALLLRFFPASADEIVPTAYPFLPELTVNAEPDVCGPFHAVVTEAFLSPDNVMSVVGREWPEAQVEPLSFERIEPATVSETGYASSAMFAATPVDIDGDGDEEVLALAARQFNWRGNMNFLVLYPTRASFETAADLVRADGIERVDLEKLLGASLDVTPQGGSGHIESVSADQVGAANFLRWTWSERRVLRINGSLYLLDEGEPWDESVRMSLWRLKGDGQAFLACSVVTVMGPADEVREKWGFAFTPLAGTPVEVLAMLLRRISGEDLDGGTLQAHAAKLREAEKLATRLATRPWVLQETESYNSRRAIDAALWLWGTQGIWNFRQASQLTVVEAEAMRHLTVYYRDTFGIEEMAAERQARAALDNLVGGYFTFRGHWSERIDHEAGFWQGLRRSVMEWPQVVLLHGVLPPNLRVRYATAEELKDWPLIQGTEVEPLLFYALEHPNLVQALLDRGIGVDARNGMGKTALMYAAHLDLPETAAILVAAGADPNAQTSTEPRLDFEQIRYRQRTALMYALENAGAEMVALLLKAGADPNAQDSGERGALDYLALNESLTKKERAEIEAMLHEAGYRAATP